jgi:hypothetical protein
MRASTLLTISLALGLAGCGGPILFAELELPSVEVTLPQYSFPGAPIGVTMQQDIAIDIGANVPLVNEPNVEFDLKLTRMTLVLDTSGPMSNFDDLRTVTITALAPAGSGLSDLTLLSYFNPDSGTPQGITRITRTSETNADLKPFLQAGQLHIRAEYSGGSLPISTWTADVTGEFAMKVKLDYGAYL